MIVRRIPPKQSASPSFQKLGQYIVSEITPFRRVGGIRGKEAGATLLGKYVSGQTRHDDRVERVRITNCRLGDNLQSSLKEIEATQGMCRQLRADPNYHLLVSFPPGETPTQNQIDDIEDSIVRGLGLEEHQRISALHADKAHLHLHVAINRVHPRTYRAFRVPMDHMKLAALAVELEIKHGLERTNHEFPAERGQARRSVEATIEAHTAHEPFTDWVKRAARNDIKVAARAGGWQAIQEAAACYGLEFRQRGAGLVIGKINEPALNMKASDLDRALGFLKLTERFGAFEPAGERARSIKPVSIYMRTVPPEQRPTNGLWEAYVLEHDKAQQAKRDMEIPNREYLQRVDAHFKAEFAKVKNWQIEMFDPRMRFAALKKSQEQTLSRHYADVKKQREELVAKHPIRTWPDWLKSEVEKSNELAVVELRRQSVKSERYPNTLVRNPEDTERIISNRDLKPKATRSGDIVYRMSDGGTVVDRKEGIDMPMISPAAAELVLDMVRERGGCQPLSTNGTKEQEDAILEAAIQLKADITFADPTLETERQRRMMEPLEILAQDQVSKTPAEEMEDALCEQHQVDSRVKTVEPASIKPRDVLPLDGWEAQSHEQERDQGDEMEI